MDQCALALAGSAHIEQVGPYREERLRNGRRLQPIHTVGHRQRLAGRGDTVLRVATAIGQRTDLVAYEEFADTFADGHDFTGHFQARVGIHAGLERVFAGPLQGIGAIDPSGMHADQHFAFRGAWH
ncbi:hypothetical protein D3C73_626860 [compost metagenome]